jgi:hypothetical protein
LNGDILVQEQSPISKILQCPQEDMDDLEKFAYQVEIGDGRTALLQGKTLG